MADEPGKDSITADDNPTAIEDEPRESTPDTTKQESPEPQATSDSQSQDTAELPKPKKRLTLQERLAQAAKGKKKQGGETTASPTLSRTASVEEIKPSFALQQELDRLKLENASLTEKLRSKSSFDKEKSELLAKLSTKDDTIQQLLKEGEALSLRELKLNETIKKLKAANQDLESNLHDYSIKSEESTLKLEEFNDFLKSHKFKTTDQLINKYQELNAELAKVKSELGDAGDWEKRYNDLLKNYEEEAQSRKDALKESNELKIQLNMLKRQHGLELEARNASIKDLKLEMSNSKQNYSREISRLEEKIESLRLENESNEAMSESTKDEGKIDFDEFNKLSETHHNLQKQYLSAQENWKAIESSLLLKIDNLSSSAESLKKSKQKLSQDLAKLNNSLQSQSVELKNLRAEIDTLKEEKNQLQLTVDLKDNDNTELNEKLEKLQSVYNQERANLNAKIQNLNDKLKEEKKPERLNLNREYSVSSGLSWDNDIRLGESSTTPAMNRDFSTFLDRNISQSSFTEIGDDIYDREQYSFHSQVGGGSIGGGNVPSSSHSNNIQLVNKMSSNIRRLEIELNTLKEEYSKVSEAKEEVEQELLESIKLNDEVRALQAEVQTLQQVISDNESKEQTMLELIGEKSEQVEELKADIVDLKELLKQQVQQLVEQSRV
ncbi:Protein SGM1 [Candida viswanathii]|uniref:Protein SGM1 n=1 Tax=Candida viswanathii TaxID=5486 RepID=A0A367YFS4_9ASCO|nr:Protein SGM1 [Candida viswanathii]